ncbi:FMN-dependent NADH-azoreductase [Dyella sp.]|jgi:FMN-dependent NADH-azoreductase|uniref:FMN-dependent NADH-azoreductase n=1 Tax=Dyella sp. TaxID=1869338 RepID=UPI002D775754|nr:NAD(P)H-dependent oxidoreductase [Dyella sp.]HET6432371.1 NAD(P)H-dependent oxidoreductase [Dyella sp.]
MNVLHLDTSALGAHSVSRQLTAAIVAQLVNEQTAAVTYHDLASEPLSHWLPNADPASAEAQRNEAVLQQFLDADVVVIGAPMYNFSITTQLKAWLDRVMVAGRTFRYGPNGPEGLAGGKRVIIASSRGGKYSEGPAAAMDFQEPYLRTALGFIGITDVVFVRAEGVAMGDEARQAALQAAHAAIGELALRKAA